MSPTASSSYLCSLSDQASITSALSDLTPVELGRAVTSVRATMALHGFEEVMLSPLTSFSVSFKDEVVDVAGLGQLRFNTEPEIWAASRQMERFYSVSSLFRREKYLNILRRPAFWIVDFYHRGAADHLLDVFQEVISNLASIGLAERIANLPFEAANYDAKIDGPAINPSGHRWVITAGYDAAHSFYEVDGDGESDRREIFLATPSGYLEVGVLGRTGWNRNPHYQALARGQEILPDLHRSGMCFGLERLLFAERILSLMKP